MAGQTLHDRLNAARHTLSGQNLARAVCKATTEEIIGPKKKHLDYLIQCTTEPNVSVPELCNLLIERTQHSSWVIVFKALITAHHLMCYGNERFIQCMATNSCKFHLSNFVDRAASQGYEMSTFVRRYAKYLNVKAACYRTMGADFCKMKRGKEEGVLRNMSTDSLLKSLPTLQEHLDALIEFDCNPDDLSNGVMNSGFMLLYRDLIQLFAVYNDGIINLFEHAANATTNVGPHSSSQFRLPPDTHLHSEPSKHTLRTEDAHLSVHPKNLTANGGLEKFFTMNKKHCKEALDIYKKFIVVMDKVSDFLKVAESVGIDKGNIPDLTKAPASLLEEMETHLTYLEGKKGHISTAPARANSIQTAVTALNSTGTAFTSSITSNDEINGLTIDESMRRAVEEEAAIMNQMKFSLLTYGDVELSEPIPKIWTPEEQRQKEKAVRQPASDTPSVIPSPLPPPGSAASISPATKPKDVNQQLATKAAPQSSVLDDLMSINPAPVSQQPFPQVPFTGFPAEGVNNSQPAEFVSEDAFKSAFVGTAAPEPAAYDAFGQVLLPRSSASPTSSSPVPELNDPKSSPTSKLISSDLDSSLQSLVQNLDIDGAKKPVNRTPGHQWSSPKPVTKTGGTNWAPAAHPMTNYPAPQAIQVQAMPTVSQYPTSGVFTHAQYAYQQVGPGMVAQPAYVIQGVWPTPPAGYGVMAQPMQNAVFVQAPAGMIMHPSPQRSVADGSNPNANPQATGWPASNDPFGAL